MALFVRRDALSADTSFARSDFVVELLQKVQADEPVNSPALSEVVCVNAEVGELKTKRAEACNTDYVSRLFTDGRADLRDRLSLPSAVSEAIEHFGVDHCL